MREQIYKMEYKWNKYKAVYANKNWPQKYENENLHYANKTDSNSNSKRHKITESFLEKNNKNHNRTWKGRKFNYTANEFLKFLNR